MIVSTSGTPSVSISGGGLTWNSRGTQANGASGKVWAFYAVASSVLTSTAVTANLAPSQKFVLIAFGISGVNTSSPFDSNLGTVAKTTGSSSTASVSLTTASVNDFLIGALFVANNPTVTLGAEFSTVATTTYGTQLTGVGEYKNAPASGAQTIAFSLSSSNWQWAIIGDAVVPLSAELFPYQPTQPLPLG